MGSAEADGSAAARWRAALEAWAIPQELLDAVDESPYGWPQRLWARRSQLAREESAATPTVRRVEDLVSAGGAIVDVGAGRGRASLPLAAAGRRLVAVEADPGMARGLAEEARRLGIEVDVIVGRWPDVRDRVGSVDVAMCANVVYDVQEIRPFVAALDEVARAGVVIELTATHPWANLARYYRTLHGLDRPDGPTVEDFGRVVTEVIGVGPTVERWSRGGQLWFDDWGELLAMQRKRLVLPPERDAELRALLEPDVLEIDGRLFLGDAVRSMATVWWRR